MHRCFHSTIQLSRIIKYIFLYVDEMIRMFIAIQLIITKDGEILNVQ